MALGAMARSWRERNWPQISISSGSGVRLLGRPAFHHVADVDILPPQGDAFFLGGVLDHLGEQLSGAAHERDALGVFVGAGAFAHEDQRRVLVAHSEDQFVAPLVQAAAAAIADIVEDLRQRVVRGGRGLAAQAADRWAGLRSRQTAFGRALRRRVARR